MKRKKLEELIAWKHNKARKPLILRGARQVGKSHLLDVFGKSEFISSYHFDFEKQGDLLLPLFEKSLDPKTLLQNLSLFVKKQINPEKDLIILDEIQLAPRALTSLKYFAEEMPSLHICAAGSLLGITLSNESFPVGKVDYIDLHPMNFEEFLGATDNEMLLDIYTGFNSTTSIIPDVAHRQFWELLKQFYVTGGMPAAVQAFMDHGDALVDGFDAARSIQSNILRDYISDINKHSGKINAMHIAGVFSNIPIQLAHALDAGTQRYRFKDVLPRKKSFAEFDGPITWLEHAGLIHKIFINNRPELPLKSFCKSNTFKLMLIDHGLLAAALELSPNALILQDYGISKGYFAESFVAQELVTAGTSQLFSWSEQNSEIEFLQTYHDRIVPIEVKAGHRTKAKSFAQYLKKYKPPRAYKISSKPFSVEKGFISLPLYLAGKIPHLS